MSKSDQASTVVTKTLTNDVTGGDVAAAAASTVATPSSSDRTKSKKDLRKEKKEKKKKELEMLAAERKLRDRSSLRAPAKYGKK